MPAFRRSFRKRRSRRVVPSPSGDPHRPPLQRAAGGRVLVGQAFVPAIWPTRMSAPPLCWSPCTPVTRPVSGASALCPPASPPPQSAATHGLNRLTTPRTACIMQSTERSAGSAPRSSACGSRQAGRPRTVHCNGRLGHNGATTTRISAHTSSIPAQEARGALWTRRDGGAPACILTREPSMRCYVDTI